jgi:hypothetical protein
MNEWNPHKLKNKEGQELSFVSSFTNFSISLQKGILKRFEQRERTVSIIIQGPLHERSISTINNYLRYGEVIVSCWDTDDLSRLDNHKDKIKIVVNKYKNVKVKNKKPGKQAPWIYQNITTLSGIKKATGFFCIKVRSDESYPILEPFISKLINNSHINKKNGEYQWFKIITSNIYFRFSRQNKFHPSDHIVAGERTRMLDVFKLSTELCNKKRISQFPEQLLCRAVIESFWDKNLKRVDVLDEKKCTELMKKHFNIIRIRDLPNHIWTSSYRKYDALYNEEDWCHDIELIDS